MIGTCLKYIISNDRYMTQVNLLYRMRVHDSNILYRTRGTMLNYIISNELYNAQSESLYRMSSDMHIE